MKSKQLFYKSKKCGEEIGTNTNSRLVFCKCGKLGVDGNEYYVRIIGKKDDSIIISKK